MDCNDPGDPSAKIVDKASAAVNPLILDYYKKFGRKRDLEQYFSLSTAESEVRDVSSAFWRKMKSQDSSDSGSGRKSESSTELCRISIKCSIPDPCSSQDENTKTKSDTDSPPIITEDVESRHTDDEFANEDNQSQKSMDALLDTSVNKPLSPTSSITSQRKLEWDSLADVGYANESDRKGSASSLSTLERLALKQQYSNNDTKHDTVLGLPTAHSTPVDIDIKTKNKKGAIRKTTKIYQKDVDIVEVNMPQGAEAKSAQSINVNLTKHISFNMDKDGSVSVENVTNANDINVTPNEDALVKEAVPNMKTDKEIQTSLTKSKEKSASSELSKSEQNESHKNPVLISLNTLKKRYKRRKSKAPRRKLKSKLKLDVNKENVPIQEKSTEQVSAAESFEYMPGHVYNQNQMNFDPPVSHNIDNKSSLESSGALTTDSSKSSKHSFTKDLERSIEILKMALQKHHNDSELKNKLVKEVVQRLLKSRYRDDESTTDFLSGLSFSSKKLGLGENRMTTSTSDSNNTESKPKAPRPKKSILRLDKFNSNVLASTSQSAPNLPAVSSSEIPVITNPLKQMTSNTESDISSGGKNSSDTAFAKNFSEELYQKYLEALRREEAYKKHLKDKEVFLKQKLVSSDTAFKTSHSEAKVNNRLKDLINDLTRNNYDDGSGDASKLEGGSNTNLDLQRPDSFRKQRSHSVFTLSSGNSDDNRKPNLKKRLQNEIKQTSATATATADKHCCCPHHFIASKVGVVDSSVQVNICEAHSVDTEKRQGHIILPCNIQQHSQEQLQNVAHVVPDDLTGDIKYVCLCNKKSSINPEAPENMLIYKCSRLMHTDSAVQPENSVSKTSNTIGVQCMGNCQSSSRQDVKCQPSTSKKTNTIQFNKGDIEKISTSSQTNIALKILKRRSHGSSSSPSSSEKEVQGSPLNTKNNKHQHKNIEVSRYVQTEISIHPRISDPSLTDINILNDGESVRVVSEHSKQVVNFTSDEFIKDSNSNDIQHDDAHIFELPEKNTEILCKRNTTNMNTESKINNEIQSCLELNNNEIPASMPANDFSTDNFKIPIQGTNMTLMVRIGSKPEDKKTYVCTDKTKTTEKATCLPEECSKGIQSNDIDIFATIDKKSMFPIGQSPPESPRKEEGRQAFYQQCTVKAYTMGDVNRHTYPRNFQISPKPLLRSNTDTGKFVSMCGVQTDSIKKRDCITQECISKQSLPTRDTDSETFEKTKANSDKSSSHKSSSSEASRKSSGDPITDLIKDITRRYTKKDVDKTKRKKCYKEIMNVLSYLLNTEDGAESEQIKFTEISSARDTDCDYSKNVKERDKISLTSKKEKYDSGEQLKSGSDHSTDPKKDKSLCDCHKKLLKKVGSSPEKQKIEIEQPCKEDKAVQSSLRSSSRRNYTESSEIQATTEIPSTSSESATCKVLSRIKRECEKYHQRRCKCHATKKCEASSSTSATCEQCKKIHHCSCRGHRCHRTKSSADKLKKKCVAYNLIIQTSDSMVSEETMINKESKTLKNIVVKVPHRRKQMENAPFKEVYTKIEKTLPPSSPRSGPKILRSNSLPNESEMSSVDDYRRRNKVYSVKEYLEINRPDFVEKSSNRQESLKRISETRDDVPRGPCAPNLKMVVVHTPNCRRPMDPCNMYYGGVPMTCNCNQYNPYAQCMQSEVKRIDCLVSRANQRAAKRQLLSVQLDRRPSLTSLSESDLRQLAESLGMELRRKKVAAKFISEREMKKHSEKIYKSLPEVVQKKEDAKKENVKKTNLLMANIFKKNLQKKTLRGSVNLSNYSTVIKI